MAEENTDFKGRRAAFLEAVQKSKKYIRSLPVGGEIKTRPSKVKITSRGEAILISRTKKYIERNQKEKDATEQRAEEYTVIWSKKLPTKSVGNFLIKLIIILAQTNIPNILT